MKVGAHTATLIYQHVYMENGKIHRFDNKLLRRAPPQEPAKTYVKERIIRRESTPYILPPSPFVQLPVALSPTDYEDDFAPETRTRSPLAADQ